MMKTALQRWLPVFKYAVYTLLTVNIWLFLLNRDRHEAIDSFGWLLLLAAFEWESRTLDRARTRRGETVILAVLQIAGYGLAAYGWLMFWRHDDWHSLANSTLWLLLGASLAYDLSVPGALAGRNWRIHNALRIALYVGIAAIAAWWGVTGNWLDFYDAALWLLCFLVIEANIFRFESITQPDAASAA